MSYAYPIYDNKVSKDVIRFYHCSDKKSEVRVNKTEHVPGTILDDGKQVLYTPKYSVVLDANKTHNKMLKILDCTVIHLYFMDGQWYMGTKNSWNIRKIYDFTSTTYGEFFEECLEQYPKFSYDTLDRSKMYTLIFTNPKCHLFADRLAVYVYSQNDYLSDVFEVLPEESEYNNYVLLSEEENTICIRESKNRELCLSKMYSNRRRLYSQDHNFAVVKTLICAFCKCKQQERPHLEKYLTQNINSNYIKLVTNVLNTFGHFEDNRNGVTNISGVNVPISLQDVHSTYSEKDIGFFVNLYKALHF